MEKIQEKGVQSAAMQNVDHNRLLVLTSMLAVGMVVQ